MHTIFVMIFWLHALDAKGTVEIDSVELGGIAPSAEVCGALPHDMAAVLKPVDDAVEKLKAGLIPKVVCGMATPESAAEKTERKAAPDVGTSPGNGDWGNGPSGAV